MNNFYIYLHIDPITNKVRYIGKGNKDRAYDFKKRYSYHKNWIESLKKQGLKPIVIFAAGNLTNEESKEKEIELIKYYREKSEPLTNRTNGGDGSYGYKHSEEIRQKMSRVQLKNQTERRKLNASLGQKNSELSKKHMIELHDKKRGVPLSLEHRKKLCLNKNNKSIICLETNQKFISIREAGRILNINNSFIARHLKGKVDSVKGLTFKYA